MPSQSAKLSRHLIVKLSSMGDVIHALPIVADVARNRPDVVLDWATESPYIDLLKLHPDIGQVFDVSLRQLKKQPVSIKNWRTLMQQRKAIASGVYTSVLDCQGLLKSAWVGGWNAAPLLGLSAVSAREPLAARFYNQRFDVAVNLHAVTRNRQLAAAAFGYALKLDGIPDYGLRAGPTSHLSAPYVVFLHATSRDDKCWPEASWITLGRALQKRGLHIVLPWGNDSERARSERLSAALTQTQAQAHVPAKMALSAAASWLQGAACVVGVDTGLAHLAVALGRPTVGLYLSTQPALTGLFPESGHVVNLGGGSRAAPVALLPDAVLATVLQVLA